MKKTEYDKMYRLENDHFWFVGKRFFIQTYLEQIKSQINKILDVGCGTGGTTKFLQKYGKVTGVEKNIIAINLAKSQRLTIIKGEAENLPFNNETFDLVTFFDVLYHKDVGNVEKAVREGKRILRPLGYLIITDSAFELLRGKHADSVFEKRRFTLNNLENRLTKNGFIITKSSYIFMSVFPFVFIKRVIVDRFINQDNSDVFNPPGIINNLLKLIIKMEALLVGYLKLPLGSSLIILARKK